MRQRWPGSSRDKNTGDGGEGRGEEWGGKRGDGGMKSKGGVWEKRWEGRQGQREENKGKGE